MADVLVGTYVAVMLSLITLAAYTAVLDDDAERREDARKVLTILVTASSASGLVGLLVKLHEAGLLR